MHCTASLNTDRPVPHEVGIRIMNASTQAVVRAGLDSFTKVQIQRVNLLKITKYFQYILKIQLQIDSQIQLYCLGLEPHIKRIFENCKTRVHDRFETSPKFKYSPLLCCIKRNISSIHKPATYHLVRKNDCAFQGLNPETTFIFES